jgi:hypothetical protein
MDLDICLYFNVDVCLYVHICMYMCVYMCIHVYGRGGQLGHNKTKFVDEPK